MQNSIETRGNLRTEQPVFYQNKSISSPGLLGQLSSFLAIML